MTADWTRSLSIKMYWRDDRYSIIAESPFKITSSGADDKMRTCKSFNTVDPGSSSPFAKLFSPPFSNIVSHRKGIYFQKKLGFQVKEDGAPEPHPPVM